MQHAMLPPCGIAPAGLDLFAEARLIKHKGWVGGEAEFHAAQEPCFVPAAGRMHEYVWGVQTLKCVNTFPLPWLTCV